MGSPFYPQKRISSGCYRMSVSCRYRCKGRRSSDARHRRGRAPHPPEDVTPRDSTRQLKAIARPPPPPRPLRLSRRSHSAALPPTTTPHFPLAHECPNRDAQSRSARHHHPDSAPAQSWIGRRLFRQCLKDTGRAFCWHPETPGAGWKLTHGLRAGLVSPAAFAALYGSRCATHGHSAPGRYVCVWPRASGSGTQPFECGAFQTVEVAFARCRLLKDMLRHFKRRDGLAD